MDDIDDFKIFFIAVPTRIINIDNNAIVIVHGLAILGMPAIIVVVVVINMHTAYKVAHTIFGVYVNLIHIITIALYFL